MDKKAAFNETRQYTIQSLASVAYQVNTLAYALLQTLQLQADKIEKMSSQVTFSLLKVLTYSFTDISHFILFSFIKYKVEIFEIEILLC